MANKEDMELQSQIADRAVAMFKRFGVRVSKSEMLMDLHYANKVCPLRWQELLEADDFNFSHDIGGIYKHFNRQTLKMEDCFVPRFAART